MGARVVKEWQDITSGRMYRLVVTQQHDYPQFMSCVETESVDAVGARKWDIVAENYMPVAIEMLFRQLANVPTPDPEE